MNLERGRDVTEVEPSVWYPGGMTQRTPHQEEEWFRNVTAEEVTPEEDKREEMDAEGGSEPQVRQEGKRGQKEENTGGGSMEFAEEKPELPQWPWAEQRRATKPDSNVNQQGERNTTLQPGHVPVGTWQNQVWLYWERKRPLFMRSRGGRGRIRDQSGGKVT
ncbi:hypothetical protein NDU88_006168 [Pleurodeles waltl]|uniref:Uncharacterized protein n=1 Tax=Pleurodeles waltl TaxID=8319 RepID=A0AAV7TD67_PLEWA|nr:hypothetical protein NDU88_006168 [Pleurodeles waltl]